MKFRLKGNKKTYLSDMNQILQHYILKSGVIWLRISNEVFAAKCLEHSLQEKPTDVEITEGKVINDIVGDSNFKKAIKDFVNKSQETGQISNSKKVITFAKGNLGLSLHNATLKVNGKRQKNNKWKLNITILDLYDFTKLKRLQEYIVQNATFSDNLENFAAAVGNNIAIIGSSCKVVNTYNITIRFTIENWEG